MTSLTVTVKGQITLKRDLLRYMGIRPGEKIEVEALPGGELRLRAAGRKGSIEGFCGVLAGKTDKVATIEEMNEATKAGWAGHE